MNENETGSAERYQSVLVAVMMTLEEDPDWALAYFPYEDDPGVFDGAHGGCSSEVMKRGQIADDYERVKLLLEQSMRHQEGTLLFILNEHVSAKGLQGCLADDDWPPEFEDMAQEALYAANNPADTAPAPG